VDAGATLTINGTMTVSGGTITNNGTIAYGAAGALVYGSSARTVGAEWPASNGPLNVTVGTGGITLNSARTISSTGKLTLNGTFATNGNLTLASDANGTAVVLGGGNDNITDNVTVQRFLPWSGANHNGFRFVGHPLRTNPALNTVTSLPTATNTVIGYNNASNSYTAVSDRSTTWPQATGYGVWTGGATNTLSFSGELQLDAVPAVAMGTATNRWNYAANPFPSVMDWHEVTKTNIEGTIYRWDKSTATLSAGSNQAAGTWGTYVVATTTAANGGSRYMAPMQGFMVQATSGASSASLAYPSSARVDQSATYVRQQQIADVARARVTHQASGFGLETVLCFLPQASNTYDANLEARYVSDGVAASQDLYTRDAQGQNYSIQSLPELALNAQTRIPLHLENTQAGATYTWTLDLSGLTTGHQAWLEDTRLGTLTPVVAGQTQPFTAQAGDAVDRFQLVFAAQGTSVQGLDPHEKVTALVSDGRLNLRGLRQTPARLSWMDLSGRVLGHETLNDPDQVLTCPHYLQEGQYYLLSVQSPQGSYHFRLRR
jgi:predicted lipoprotein with Yx(FWY)xxD motif